MISSISQSVTHYKLSDGRVWDISKAAWVSSAPKDAVIGAAPDENGNLSEKGLLETLMFYNKPLGVLLSVDAARKLKSEEVQTKWQEAELKGTVNSSLGFTFDATERSIRDVAGLIAELSSTGKDQAAVADTSGNLHPVDLNQLKILQVELVQYGQSLYTTKWQLLSSVAVAKTPEEVMAISIKFTTNYTPSPVVIVPDHSGMNIDEKSSGPAIARALEWVGGTDQALVAGAISGLAKSEYSTSVDATSMLGSGYTAWMHEFTGSGDVTQTIPNITNERDGFLLFIKNSKTSGNITLVPGGDNDTIDGLTSYTITPGHAALFISCNSKSRWVLVYETGQHESI